jgi:hypothetical protein
MVHSSACSASLSAQERPGYGQDDPTRQAGRLRLRPWDQAGFYGDPAGVRVGRQSVGQHRE